VVLVMGLSPAVEGEEMRVRVPGFEAGDRTDIVLPATQEALLRRTLRWAGQWFWCCLGALAVNRRRLRAHPEA
jgi:beta-glucosidase